MILIRELKILWQKALYSDRKKSILQKWKQSLLAIIFALLLTLILIVIKGENPFLIFMAVIEGATRNAESLNDTLLFYAMFILAGLSIIIAFRSGLFNIGIGGQMLISGVVIMILAVKTALPWPLLLIIGMLIGAVAAAFAGALKALFNIHEVVSSILINWIFFYVSQYLLNPSMSWVDEYGSTLEIANRSRMQIGESLVLPALMVAIFLLLAAILLFKTTKWGYALKATGQNNNAAKYAGIRVGIQLTLGMALSGLVAGALASVNYLGRFGSMSQATGQSLPSIGFQGISVALIAFKSFFGLLPAALFWAIITSGSNYVSIVYPNVPREVLQLMNGFIIYMIAISIIFLRFRPLKIIWLLYLKMTSPEIKKEREKLKRAKKAQLKLFSGYENQLKKLDQSKTVAKITSLKQEKKKLLLVSKAKEKQFAKNLDRPPLYKYLFNLNQYKNELNVYENKKYLLVANEYQKYEDINNKIEAMQAQLLKKLIAKNKANYKNALAIIESEYHTRTNLIFSNYVQKSFIGKWKLEYALRKHKANFFAEKYNLLKLNLKQNLRLKQSQESQNKIKKEFANDVQKLKNQTKKLTIKD